MMIVEAPTVSKRLDHHLSKLTFEDLLKKPKKKLWENLPEPDYRAWDNHLAAINTLSVILGQEKGISKKELKSLSAKLFDFVDSIDLCIEFVSALPESVTWKKKADDKLIHLANRIEDVAEVCELALDEEFTQTIKDRVQKFLNESQDS